MTTTQNLITDAIVAHIESLALTVAIDPMYSNSGTIIAYDARLDPVAKIGYDFQPTYGALWEGNVSCRGDGRNARRWSYGLGAGTPGDVVVGIRAFLNEKKGGDGA